MIYFNEWEKYVARWTCNLFPNADIDDRDIKNVSVIDPAGYNRVHLFSGIAGWEYALNLAGWPDDEPVWTGSCPCQPFSQAGKKKGVEDERHLWPEMYRLIEGNRPSVIFGEQVAGELGLGWFDGVRTDLGKIGYTCGMAILPACCVGTPHRRYRIFWVADTMSEGQQRGSSTNRQTRKQITKYCSTDTVAHSNGEQWNGSVEGETTEIEGWSDDQKHTEWWGATESQRTGAAGPWGNYRATLCGDGKWRRVPVEPRVFPLAYGVSNRVGKLRAWGNAIVPQVAAVFIRSYMEARGMVAYFPKPPVPKAIPLQAGKLRGM